MVDPISLIVSIVIMILVGGLAGWAASHIVRGHDYGLWTNVLIGIVGAVLFGLLFSSFLPIGNGILATFLGALIGAIVLLLILKLFKRCCT
jgi:uncharacterized membrane protein YeaQ/YmgE (transglycosylase-associated protein family)